jgi:hypothetical protein
MADHLRVKLRGGLGNQLHIFIAAWVIGKRSGRGLLLDGRFISWTGSNPDRKIEIHKLQLPSVLNLPTRYLRSVTSLKGAKFLRLGILKLIDILTSFRDQENIPLDAWENFEEVEEYARLNYKLEGHFLDLRWLLKAFEIGFPDHLKIASKNKNTMIANILKSEQCAIHVRLTDFLDSKNNFAQLSEDYYLNAVELMRKEGLNQFIVYSDDVSRLKQDFPRLMSLENIQVTPSSLDAAESFYLMHNSAAIITANSTFSTLAAMFVWRRGGQVIAPNKRILNAEHEKYWLPQQWIILDYKSGLIS